MNTIREDTFLSVHKLLKAIINPAYTPLLALFETPHPRQGRRHYHFTVYHSADDVCQFSPEARFYYWLTTPDGALEGALVKALLPVLITTQQTNAHFAVYQLMRFVEDLLHNQNEGCQQVALEAIERWLKT